MKKTAVCILAFFAAAAFFLSADAAQAEGMRLVKELRGTQIRSPKSVIFTQDGSKFYINSLEGCKTAVYDTEGLALRKVIEHHFTAHNAHLFKDGESTAFDYVFQPRARKRDQNSFYGKPVESALSHDGRMLWVTYYRRDYDNNASSPSAVALIDTQTDEIVRVMPTGPLPKMVAASPDTHALAVTHWGDNSIGLMDISGDDPNGFAWHSLMVSGSRVNMASVSGDRDANCGHCLRGTVFAEKGRYLFVARMHGTGIAVFDTQSGRELGVFAAGRLSAPRHLALSPDGSIVYVTAYDSVYAFSVRRILAQMGVHTEKTEHSAAADAMHGKKLTVGSRARTLALSPDGRRMYVVCNGTSKLYRVDIDAWKITAQAPVAPYAVGLAVSPDERLVITTSQGRKGHGGDVVSVFDSGIVHEQPAVKPETKPETEQYAPGDAASAGDADSAPEKTADSAEAVPQNAADAPQNDAAHGDAPETPADKTKDENNGSF